MEEYVYVLDYLPNGPTGARGNRVEPLVYAIGESEFRLFELVAKPRAAIQFGDRVYIGSESSKRTVIDHVKRRIKFDELTPTAQSEIEYAVHEIVMASEAKYVGFYNNAQGLSLKKHALQELPGLGAKARDLILEERKKGNFKTFAEITERIPTFKQADMYIVKRILEEISEGDHKHYLFVPRDPPRRA